MTLSESTATSVYSGTTNVTGTSVLLDGANNAFSPNSLISLGSSSGLSIGYNETIGGLAGSGTVNITGSDTLKTNGGSGSAFSGSIMGSGGNLEVTAGDQMLSGTNSYGGTTKIDSGATLQLGDGSNIGSITTATINDAGTLAINEPGCTTFDVTSQAITGGGGVEIMGGMVTFLGTFNYTGTTKIDCSATLDLGNSDLAGTVSGPVLDNGTLVFETGPATFSNGISGGGSVTIEDNPLTLGGTNTYSGTTTVNGQALNDGGIGSFSPNSQISLENGATLAVGYNETIGGLAGTCSTTVNIANLKTLISNGSCGSDFSGLISASTGSLEISGGTQILSGSNAYTGGTKIDFGGTLQLGDGENTGSIMTSVTDNGTLAFNNPECTTFSNGITGGGGVSVLGGMLTLAGGAGTNAYSGTTRVTGSSELTDAAADSFSAASQISLAGCASLAVDYNETVAGLAGTCNTGVTIGGGDTLFTKGSSGSDFLGEISGCGNLEVTAGRQILSGSNGYGGTTTIDSGAVLQLGNGCSTGSITTAMVTDNGTLAFDEPGCTTFDQGICGSGGVEIVGGMFTYTGTYGYTGTTTIDCSAVLDLGTSCTSGLIPAAIVDNGTLVIVNSSSSTLNNLISGSGRVRVESNPLTLNALNTYSGTTTVDGVELNDANADSFSPYSRVCLINGANLVVGYSETIGGLSGDSCAVVTICGTTLKSNGACGSTFAGMIEGCGGIFEVASGDQILTNSNSYSGGTKIDSGATLELGDGESTGAINDGVVDNGTLVFNNYNCTTFSGITGGGGIRIEDGMLTLTGGTGSNTYGGTTCVTNGAELADGCAGSFSPNSLISLNCGAYVQVNNNETIGGLAGTCSTGVDIAGGMTLVSNGTGGSAFAGEISGCGNLEIANGNQIVTGSNSYGGTTTIDALGTLTLGDTECTGSINNGVIDNGSFDFNNPGCYSFSTICGTGDVVVENGMVTLSGTNTYSGVTSITNNAELVDGAANAFSPFSQIYLSNCSSLTVNDAETINGLAGTCLTAVTLFNSSVLKTNGTGGNDFAGTITGTGGIEIGAGASQTLAGANSYSLGTAIDLGATLQLGDGSTEGSLPSTSLVTDLGTLAFNNPSPTSFPNVITGTGGVMLNGGVVTLTGSNTYTGPTTLNQGTLYITSASSLGSTNSIVVNDPVMAPTLAPSGADIALSTSIAIPSTGLNLNVSGSANILTLNGVISDNASAGVLMINGPVVLNGINTYSGGTTINGINTAIVGLAIGNTSGLGTGPVTSTYGNVSFNSSTSPLLSNLTMAESTFTFNGPTAELSNMVSDGMGSTNSIVLGNNTALTLNDSSGHETDYYGTISDTNENGSLDVNGAGAVFLDNSNTYGGGTAVSNGVLIAGANGALGSGEVTVNGVGVLGVGNGVTLTNQVAFSGGGVGGYGTFSPTLASSFNISGGSVIAAGRGTVAASGDGAGLPVQGNLTFAGNSTLTFGQNGIYEFAIQGAGTTAGVNYSTITVNSSFAIAATPSQPFEIEILSVQPSGALGTDSSFNPMGANQWTLLTAPTTISGFSPTDFVISTTMFNAGAVASSQFSVSLGGTGNDSLILNFTPVPEPSTWALMIGGLCMLAGAAVRRRRRA